MIEKLKGIIDEKNEDSAVIDVNGVCYGISLSSRALRLMPEIGEKAVILIETSRTETAIHLYGFTDRLEQFLFRALRATQGVGPKAALAILSCLPPKDLMGAVMRGDSKAIAQAKGVGPKLAERIAVELKDKILKAPAPDALAAAQQGGAVLENAIGGETLSALENLGYKRAEALGAVKAALETLGNEADISALIRESLRQLSPAEKRGA